MNQNPLAGQTAANLPQAPEQKTLAEYSDLLAMFFADGAPAPSHL